MVRNKKSAARKCQGIQDEQTVAGAPAWKACQAQDSVPDPRGAGGLHGLLWFVFAFWAEMRMVAEVFGETWFGTKQCSWKNYEDFTVVQSEGNEVSDQGGHSEVPNWGLLKRTWEEELLMNWIAFLER